MLGGKEVRALSVARTVRDFLQGTIMESTQAQQGGDIVALV